MVKKNFNIKWLGPEPIELGISHHTHLIVSLPIFLINQSSVG